MLLTGTAWQNFFVLRQQSRWKVNFPLPVYQENEKGAKGRILHYKNSKEQLEKSLFLERLIKKGYEVIFFTDSVDEYLMLYLMDYKDKKFQNMSKEGPKVGKDSKVKELKEAFKELTKWWKDSLASENVDNVKICNRLADTPCVVITFKFGWSANMARILQSQTLSDANKQAYMCGKQVLEINPQHLIIKELKERVASDPEDKSVKETVYEWELLNDVKSIWLRSLKEVTEDEYTKLYHSLANDFTEEKPMAWSHFNAEGDVEFKAVLYVPPKAPLDLYESYYNSNKANLKL